MATVKMIKKVLPSEIAQAFRATSAGWRSQVDAAQKGWMHTHSLV